MGRIIYVSIKDTNGEAAPAYLLETLYASDLHFEPRIRQSRIIPDGTVELHVGEQPYMLHARLNLPLYGNIWVMAHNCGEGYRGEKIDFVAEALKTYIWETERFAAGAALSPYAEGHLEAAREYAELARKGIDPHYCKLKALSHAIFAAEAACFESAQRKLAERPRPDLLLGCNTFRYDGPDSPIARYFGRATRNWRHLRKTISGQPWAATRGG